MPYLKMDGLEVSHEIREFSGSKVFAIPGLVHHRHDRYQSRVGLWIRPLELETQGVCSFFSDTLSSLGSNQPTRTHFVELTSKTSIGWDQGF